MSRQQPGIKNLPADKRSKGGKTRAAPGEKHQKGSGLASKKRLPTALLIAWALAIICLASLLYFAAESRRLPDLSADLTAENSGQQKEPETQSRNLGYGLDNITESVKKRGETARPDSSVLSGRKQEPVPPDDYPKATEPRGESSQRTFKVSIIIDDLGPDIGIAKKFASLPFPVVLSVLPHQVHSREIAELAHRAGKEVMLHLPMEPLDHREDPGQGALLVSMSADEIRNNIRAALNNSPYFLGVNNHMGSRLTQDAQIMEIILSELKRRNLFFIDSMTTNESKGWKVAREMNLPVLKRDIFLDDNISEDAIRSQIELLARVAENRGKALAIGHPHKTTLRSLQKAASYFRKNQIEVVDLRDLMNM